MDDSDLELLPLPEDMPQSDEPQPEPASSASTQLVEVATPPPFLHSFAEDSVDLLRQEQQIIQALPVTYGRPSPSRRYFSNIPQDFDSCLDVDDQPLSLEHSPEDAEYEEFERVAKRSPPYLISVILHMSVLIALGLWMLIEPEPNTISLVATFSQVETDQLAEEPFELGTDETLIEAEIDPPSDKLTTEHQEIFTPTGSISELDLLRDPLQANPASLPDAPNNDFAPPHIGRLLKGRKPEMRELLRRKYGGNKYTEAAVTSALDWLVRNQRADGSWSLKGPYSHGGQIDSDPAATGLALLALQGDGHTPDAKVKTPYTKAVDNGWNWLLSKQNTEGPSGGWAQLQGYPLAICTIALCELYAMTGDEKFHNPAQEAVNYCLVAQGPNGGWRYTKGEQGDTSVTGWYVMALQSARMAYLDVPDEALERVGGFLDSVQSDGGRHYGYVDFTNKPPSMTAEGLLCRQYLGWKHNDERLVDGVKFLGQHPINWETRNAYYWYYATQVLHHMEGEPWNRWNLVMREVLPAKQVKHGPEQGSWDPGSDQWGLAGGRLYVTCLHTYMLEVYYRHLPIYKYRLGE